MSISLPEKKTSSQKRIILAFVFVFFFAVLMICLLMYKIFSNNLAENLHSRAIEVIDIIDYMAQTSGESPNLIRGVRTLAANRDIKLIIVRIDDPPVVIASNKAALIGLPTNEIFSESDNSQIFKYDSKTDQYTAISSIWLENKFSDGQFTKASVGIIFDTYQTRILLQEEILNTSLFLVLTTIFAIGIIYILTNKYIFKPLEVINNSLLNYSNNDFIEIPIKNNDEIGTVANTLNQLFSELCASKKILRENTERYELALQGTKVGLFDWDIETDKLYCSSSLQDLLGIDSDNFSPNINWFYERTHVEDREHAQAALVAHLKNNSEYDVEGRLRHECGDYIWMKVYGQALRDNNGKAIRMVGYYLDISERKANEHFMNSLYLLSTDATLKLEDKINSILKEGTTYLEIDCGTICRVNNENLVVSYSQSPESYQATTQQIYRLKDTFCSHTVKENDIVAISDISSSSLKNLPEYIEDGINCYVGTPLYVHGRIYGTLSFSDYKTRPKPFSEREKSFVRLISQWVGNEIMRAQYIDYLHDTENRLEAAVEELTNTNTELESFTHAASHDLQEPLRMITNYTSLLNSQYSGHLDNRISEYLKILSDSANQMRDLINDLLDYARANKENEKIENIELNEVLNHVYANLEKQIRESNALILCNNLPTVRANKASMISLLQNFISNGVKFQKSSNQPIIEVKSFQYADSLTIAISDNGIGIAQEYQAKIFEPFVKLHTKSEYNGTGIGLAVCKKIISRMGGTLWLESEIDSGSTFYISLPKLTTQTNLAA